MSASITFPFDNSYARLPEPFYQRVMPTRVQTPKLIRLNAPLARDLGIDTDALEREAAAIFSGNAVPEGASPLAMAYAGHQFGSWVPQLGDGRAILLGEVVTPSGERRDIHLKGVGRTRFSRGGDGRAVVGPVLREYIVSEAMAALGIPTTRALAAVATGEMVMRETPLPGAVLARTAASHIRVGTFQFFAARGDKESLRLLADHVIARHDPSAAEADNPYRAMLDGVVKRQAELVAQWMGVGFIHGVMNTDNTTVSGETIDYGPCAFMDTYHPATVFSSIDRMGRYAYANQPKIAHWNLVQLATAILPLLGANEEEAIEQGQAAVDAFPDAFESAWLGVMRKKLGLFDARNEDGELAKELLDAMKLGEADFTLAFRRLSALSTSAGGEGQLRSLFSRTEVLDGWLEKWRARLAEEGRPDGARQLAQRQANPAFIPRNHRVEEAIRAAEDREDFSVFETLVDTLSRPYDDQPDRAHLEAPPRPEEVVHRTFCGT